MDYLLTEEQQMLQELARQIAHERIKPIRAQLDEAEIFPWDIMAPLARGEALAAFALTEPQAGSDAGAIAATAVKDGDFYVLNGTKQWITNAGEAEFYTIIALTDRSKGARGAAAFLVEKNDPGISFGKKEKKMGIRASVTREVILEDCRVPADRLISKEGMGFIITMKTLDLARPGAGALAVGGGHRGLGATAGL